MSREEKRHKIEVHVAGICFRETEDEIQVLIAKRNENRQLLPGKWECGGGQVYAGENFEEAIKRQMQEELGVIVKKIIVFGFYQINIPKDEQKIIPGVKAVCFFDEYVNGAGPQIEEKEFSEWHWQSINELEGIDFISGIREDIRTGWEFFSKNKEIINK